MWISLGDTPTSNILAHLASTTNFITEALGNPSNKVLVHCFQGVSRSATAVIAYFISTGMPVNDAVKFTQSKRGIVRPNMGFMKQLNTFAEQYSHLPPPKQDNLFTRSIRKMKISDGIAARIRQLKSGESTHTIA
ncbi:phosphatases II [Hymenopellis radicata]|nr:phosphatases II [Hymenopellis radicata]